MSSTANRPAPLSSAVFLDRDGVLNEVQMRGSTPIPPPNLEQMRLLPGVVEACQRLRELGHLLVVITNQPDIARGRQSAAEVDRMHDFLRVQLPLDDIVVCAHDEVDDCLCRKPRPGMMLDAAGRLGIDLARSFCVGDRWRDVEAARRAGVAAIYVQRHYGEREAVDPDAVVPSLVEAAEFIESHTGRGAA